MRNLNLSPSFIHFVSANYFFFLFKFKRNIFNIQPPVIYLPLKIAFPDPIQKPYTAYYEAFL